jgi:hypothetical protein
MMRTVVFAALLLAAIPTVAEETKLTVKVEDKAPPKELSDAIRGLLDGKAMNVFDGDKLLCTVWVVKSLESKATAEQAKAGLKYTHIEETTVVGAVQFPEPWRDYRKQKVKAGVHTLRMGVQPMDGDHMGTAPFNDFLLLAPADADKKAETLEVKEMHELSAKSIGRSHPAMMLLFPNKKPPEKPAIEVKPKDHVVLSLAIPTKAGTETVGFGFSLVLVGETSAE